MKRILSLLLTLALLLSCSWAVLAAAPGSGDLVAVLDDPQEPAEQQTVPPADTPDEPELPAAPEEPEPSAAEPGPAAEPETEALPESLAEALAQIQLPEPPETVYQTQPDVQPVEPTEPEEPQEAQSAADFTDVPAGAWYYSELDLLVSLGGINGMTPTTFCPDDTMTVEQFIKVLAGCTFSEAALDYYDTGSGSWSAKYINAAYYIGALEGFDVTPAHLVQPITRYEAAWLLVAFARCRLGETVESPAGVRLLISDYAAIPQTWREAVYAAYAAGLMTGYPDGSFGGDNTLRRCEAVVTIVRLLEPERRGQVQVPELTYDYAMPVPWSDPVEDSWFSDAVFLGNSLCDGFAMYSGLSYGAFLGKTSVTVYNVLDASRLSYLQSYSYGKIYLMLGVNEIGNGTAAVVQQYDSVIQTIQTLQPNAQIYVQALLPVCEAMLSASQRSYHITNYYINEMNAALGQMCADRQVYFVNLHEAFVDASGGLPASKSWDGVHLNGTPYEEWLYYLKPHTVQP